MTSGLSQVLPQTQNILYDLIQCWLTNIYIPLNDFLWIYDHVWNFFFIMENFKQTQKNLVNTPTLFFFLIWLHQVLVVAPEIFAASCRIFLIAVHRVFSKLGFPCGSESKASPARQETWVWSPGREDPLEKEMATHSSTLAWKMPWRSLAGYCPWDCKESYTTEQLHRLSSCSTQA